MVKARDMWRRQRIRRHFGAMRQEMLDGVDDCSDYRGENLPAIQFERPFPIDAAERFMEALHSNYKTWYGVDMGEWE